MVGPHVLSSPGSLGCPIAIGSRPEGVGGGQSERQQGGGAEVEAACVDVVFRHADLTACVADAQPTLLVESAGLCELTLEDCCQGTSHLCRADVVR